MASLSCGTVSHFNRSASRPRAVPRPVAKLGKAERTRARILDSALEFLWSSPFRELTVGSLMEPTGLSRSAFYRHFRDLHEVMETLLEELESEILGVAAPWFVQTGPPLELLHESLVGLVGLSYERGPILRAIVDARPTDERLDRFWDTFLGRFDDAVASRCEGDQEQGLIGQLDARVVAIALNRLDVAMLVDAFGRRPRKPQEPTLEVLYRIWSFTLYGAETRNPGPRR